MLLFEFLAVEFSLIAALPGGLLDRADLVEVAGLAEEVGLEGLLLLGVDLVEALRVDLVEVGVKGLALEACFAAEGVLTVATVDSLAAVGFTTGTEFVVAADVLASVFTELAEEIFVAWVEVVAPEVAFFAAVVGLVVT